MNENDILKTFKEIIEENFSKIEKYVNFLCFMSSLYEFAMWINSVTEKFNREQQTSWLILLQSLLKSIERILKVFREKK